MKCKRWLSLCAILALFLCAFPVEAVAQETSYPKPFAVEEWTFLSYKDGFGYAQDDFSLTVYGYLGDGVETLQIPSAIDGVPVTAVDYTVTMSFFARDYPEVRRLVIPEGVTYIGRLTLQQLPNLEEVVLPQSLRMIAYGAFSGATSLTDITIPDTVQVILPSAFTDDVTIHADPNTYAARYAQYHGLAFEPIVYTHSAGDVNADGVCNSTDARLVLQHSVGKATLSEDVAPFADVDGDGEVTSTDARLCLQHAVGQEVATITVPTAHGTPPLVSTQAEVYAKVYYQTTVSGGRVLEKREYGPVADRLAVIQAINHIASGAYTMAEGHLLSIVNVWLTFEEPDGTSVSFELQQQGGWVLKYDNHWYYHFGSSEGDTNNSWQTLYDALN